MPAPKGTRFRVKTTPKGKKIRLAFAPGSTTVIEAKNLDTGATHTQAEFRRDRRNRLKKAMVG